ncbi:hypothetical protein F5Y00DRAFT_147708 [Daldinia vernicosa]|uniref:uncharacterized protein n=1 Tax=Daldinia vernicosa TaxID=114800 RepID=UPI002008E5AE|nr:uncharacterized protein F5Y00DRAFT_147708 [Daldinia vernicosa]KAI0846222.1 hypothetical protein F5Y00DRAFT_147708 [Daldinia vernicosa]
MAANMPQMGGGGVRQRPPNQQLSQLVYTQIMGQGIQTGGWQDQVQVNLRVSNTMNLISNSFLAMPALDSQQLVSHGLTFERDAFLNSPDKGTYDQKIGGRVQELFKRRQAHEQSLQNTLNAQAAAQAHAQAQTQQMLMNQNMMPRGMGQPPQQGFQHLQQQMQPSPIPQQPHQPGMGMGGQGGLPMNPNQQPMQMGVAQMRPQFPMNATLASLPPQDRTKIMQLALAKLNQTTEPQRNQLRNLVQQRINPQQMAQLQAENQDPVLFYLQIQMLQAFKQGGGNGGGNQAALQMQAQQRQMNQSGQQLVGVPNSEFGPFSNVESIMNQQKAGLLAQEAGQMVVPASNGPGRNATPQPMGGMQGPNPNHPGPNQSGIPNQMPQQFNLPQAQQLKMDQRAAQSQAQIRAQAQAKQMQGQPGGLNGGAISQSPGMNTLNTPVRRTPVMGQPEGQQQMGQPNGPFGQGLDPRFNQGNQRPQMGPNPMNNQHIINSVLAQMPPEQRNAFMSLPPDKRSEVLMKWTANPTARAGMGQPPGRGQPQPGQFGQGNPMAQFGPGNNMGQAPNPSAQMNAQNQMLLQQQMNRMRSMQPQNRPQMPQPQDVNNYMDSMDVPGRILDQLKTSQQPVPQEIKKWAHLKQWLSQRNANNHVMQQLLGFQTAQFQNMMKQRAANNQMAQPNMPQQGPQMPNAQMPMQPGANMGPFAGITISPAEFQQAKNHERFKGWPDEKIKTALMQMKLTQMRAKANGQAPNAQMQTPQTSQPANNNLAISAPPPNPSNALQQRPQNAGPDANPTGSAGPARNRQLQNNRPPPPASTAPQRNSLKRASTDDVVEVPNPSGTPVQRPASQQAQAAGPPPQFHIPPAQLAAMPPEQRNKYEAMMKSRQAAAAAAGGGGAQQPQQQQMSEAMLHLKSIGQEEHMNAAREPYQEIPMNPEQYQDMAQKIQSLVSEMGKVSKILGRWYTLTRDDNRARMFFKMRLRLGKQFADGEKMTTLKKAFSLKPNELDSVRAMLEGMARDVATQYPQVMKRNATQQQHAQEPGPQQGNSENTATPPMGAPTPLNAANLEKQNALNKIHHRSTSKSGQPPAAPTTSQPPFPFGAQSPNGQPTYIGKPAVTQADLQLPPRKRPKTSGQAGLGSGGASASSSPQVQKAPSPELVKRQTPAEHAAPKLAYQCPEPSCEAHSTGFATEEARRNHIEEEHVKPSQNPFKFATESLAARLGLDPDGHPKAPPNTSTTAPSMARDASKQGQTPASRADATPMSREPSMKRQGSAPGVKASDLLKTMAGKTGTPKPDVGTQVGDGTVAPAKTSGADGAWPMTTIDPQNLLQNLGGIESGGGGSIFDMNVYRAITPHDTPEDTPESSKDSASSEPTSDLSEGVSLNLQLNMGPDPNMGLDRWQPFGLGDVESGDMNLTEMDLGATDENTMPLFSWDDVNPDFTKEFTLDTSFYSLETA